MTRLTIIVLSLGLYVFAGILSASHVERDEQIVAEAERIAEEKKARVFQALAECLNGGSIKDEETVINCRRVRK